MLPYKITALPIPDGATSSWPMGINKSGMVCGYVDGRPAVWSPNEPPLLLPVDPSARVGGLNDNGEVVGVIGKNQPYFWRYGEPNYVALKGLQPQIPDFVVWANGINNNGKIVGQLIDDSQHANVAQGVIWSSQFEEPQRLGTLPEVSNYHGSNAMDINEKDVIAGTYTDQLDTAAYWSSATDAPVIFGDPSVTASVAYAINDASAPQIVGSFSYDGGSSDNHAFSYSTATSQRRNLSPPDKQSIAYDLNDGGDVVGALEGRATLWTAFFGSVRLDDPQISPARADSWDLLEARGINNAGQIVGWGYLRDVQERRAWMLTPTHSWTALRASFGPPGASQRPYPPGPSAGLRSMGEWLLYRYFMRPLFEGGGWHLDNGGKLKPAAVPSLEPMLKSITPGLRNALLAELLGRCSMFMPDQESRRTLEQLARKLLEERNERR